MTLRLSLSLATVRKTGEPPYLLLVSFYSGQINDFGSEKIQAINESPYNGVAVPLIWNDDTEKYSEKDFEATVKLFKQEFKKDIWPWIFFNKFIGNKGEKKIRKPERFGKTYFQAISGMDLYNETGALKNFINIWKIALSISKQLGSPGIVIDAEAYSNRKAYRVSYIAQRVNKSEKEVQERLKEIGGELADIANQIYPDATLWFLITHLTHKDRVQKVRFCRHCYSWRDWRGNLKARVKFSR